MTALLVGSGPDQGIVEQRIAQLGISEAIRFAGRRPSVAELLSAFDVLVLSSRTEASPMIVLEAMAAGVPIVAFAVGNIPEVLTDQSAWLVLPTDTKALSRAIRDALDCPAEAARRARQAQRILSNHHSVEGWLEKIQQIYDTVAGK